MTDFGDPEAVERDYYPEMERLVRAATGASRVLVFDHNVRIDGGAPGRDQPVRQVHNDYTAKSGPVRARDLLGADAEALAGRRVAIVNVWRPLKGPVKTAPLALADAESIAPEELVPVDLVYADRVGEIYYATHSPGAALVRLPRHDARRGDPHQGLRFRRGRPRALHLAHGLRRPEHAGRRAAAREHRGADLGDLLALARGRSFSAAAR